MRRSIISAAFVAVFTAGLCTTANALPAGPGVLAAQTNETNVTQVVWGYRRWGGWHRPRVYGFYGWRRWHRPRVYGFYGWRRWHRPRVYGFYGWRRWHRPAYGYYGWHRPRVYGWMGYRGCWW
jgi:hypothetical protein